jgi:hypothetical protein
VVLGVSAMYSPSACRLAACILRKHQNKVPLCYRSPSGRKKTENVLGNCSLMGPLQGSSFLRHATLSSQFCDRCSIGEAHGGGSAMNAFEEKLYEHHSQVFTVDPELYRGQTKVQEALIFETLQRPLRTGNSLSARSLRDPQRAKSRRSTSRKHWRVRRTAGNSNSRSASEDNPTIGTFTKQLIFTSLSS